MTRVFNIFILLSTIIYMSHTLEIQSNDAEFLRKQELIFQLLWNTKETPKNHPEVFERVKNYKIEDVATACENQTYAKEFETHLKNGMLPRGQVFSIFRDEHVDEIRTIFNIFYNAKNFDDFAAMAAWSSLVVNEMLWIHAFAIALAHRPDTKYIRLPNLYEILPHYFFNTDVVMQAYRIKTGEVAGITDQYTTEANYSGQFPPQDQDDEYKLSYFREDVGLNEFYFHFVNSFPYWMNSDDYKLQKSIRGELFYHVHKILLSRYKLERLSHKLGDIEDIDWDQPITTGFYPSMTHFNGLQFPTRPANAHVPVFKYKFVEEAKHYESRLAKAIDLGELRAVNSHVRKLYEPAEAATAFNDLCNILEGNADSLNAKLYGSLDRIYRRVLGFAPESTSKNRPLPSALEMSLASLRDPEFYRMSKKIVDYGLRFKRNLPTYKRDELSFEGVRVDYVHLDRLVTYFDEFESMLNHPRVLGRTDNGISHQSTTPIVIVKARQQRLNHKAFSYQIGVSSERASWAIVRIFLGPRRDVHGNELGLDESAQDFYELDRWIVELKQGSNKLERSSEDSVYGVADSTPSEAYNRLISRALKTADDSLIRDLVNKRSTRRGLPRRLLLPRGTQAGLALRLVVCVNSLGSSIGGTQRHEMADGSVFEKMALDDRALGFPLDRPLGDASLFAAVRNVMIKDAYVYHQDGKDVEAD